MAEKQLKLETVNVGGAQFTYEEFEYQYQWMTNSSTGIRFDVLGSTATEQLAACREVLEALANNPEFEYQGIDAESLVETFEEIGAELAEDLEIPFIYERNGRKREYTPRSMWEPSGGCEWEESASEYDYGWDL